MFTILCLLVAYLPFQIAFNPAADIDLASGRVFILLLFLLCIFWGLKNRSLKIANNLITYFLLAFLFFAGLSCFWADSPERALRKLAVFLSIFPLYFIVVSLVDSREKLERLLKYIVWPAVFLALIGIAQFILQFFIGIAPIMQFWSSKIAFVFWGRSFGAEVISNPSWLANIGGTAYLRAFSLFPDPHIFSFYLGLIIPIAIGIGITNLEFRIKNGVSGSKKKISNIKCQISNQCQKGEMSNKQENKKAKKQEETEKKSVIPALRPSEAFGEGGEAGIQSVNSQIFKNSVIENSLKIENWKLKIKKQISLIFNIIIVLTLILAQILTFSRGGYVGFGLFLLFYFWERITNYEFRIKSRTKKQENKKTEKQEETEKKSVIPVSLSVIPALRPSEAFGEGGEAGIQSYECHSERSEGSRQFIIKTTILIICIFFLLIFTNNPAKQRFMSIFNSRDGSNMGRIAIWKQSLAVAEDHFWTGVGIGNYSFYVDPRQGYRAPIYAHNTYLDILSEMGIFALLAWLGMIAAAIKFSIFNLQFPINDKIFNSQMFKNSEIENSLKIENWKLKIISLSLAGSLIWFSGHAFFDTPIYSPVILPLLIIILGLISCLSYYRLE